MSEPNSGGANPGPARASVALIAVTMALLAALAWYLNPSQPKFKPAPLDPPSAVCRNPGRQFIPSNLITVHNPDLDRLPANKKNSAFVRLNTTACTCGCQLSVVFCRAMNSACEASKGMMGKMVSEAAGPPAQTPARN